MKNKLRVAFLGDVNNNYFSFMRHLRDLNVDANLFLYKNQDKIQPRWSPESDTYKWGEWKQYVHYINFEAHWKEFFFGDYNSLKKDLKGYDIIFASGFAVALLYRAGIKLDFYLPYAVGFEILNRKPRRSLMGVIDILLQYWQTKGVKNARRTILIAGDNQSLAKAVDLNLDYKFYTTIPMVYPEESMYDKTLDPHLCFIYNEINSSDFVVSSHVRHDWIHIDKEFPDLKGVVYSKRTDILIRGFAEFIPKCVSKKPKLFLAEYGPHVDNSKKLCEELMIGDYVFWYSELKRKQIMQFLPKVDVCVGELSNAGLTCGVVLESLASGKPLLNALAISNNDYMNLTGMPLPPVLPTNNVQDVTNNLLELEADKIKKNNIGSLSKQWFDKYAGRGLAEIFLKDFEMMKKLC